MKIWTDTQWDSRFESIDSIKCNYSAILLALNDLINDGGDRAVDAKGLLMVLKDALFIMPVFILCRSLGPIKLLSDQLRVYSTLEL